eukprot:UC1_evm1s84
MARKRKHGLFRTRGNAITSIALSKRFEDDGKSIIAVGGTFSTLWVWDASTRVRVNPNLNPNSDTLKELARIARIDGPCLDTIASERYGSVTSVDFSDDGKTIVTGSLDSKVRLLDVESVRKNSEEPKGHTKSVTCVAFSPDGKLLASGSYDYNVRVWDVNTQKTVDVLKGHTGEVVLDVQFSPSEDNLLASYATDGVRIWKRQNHVFESIAVLPNEEESIEYLAFSRLAFSRGAKCLVYAGYRDLYTYKTTLKQATKFEKNSEPASISITEWGDDMKDERISTIACNNPNPSSGKSKKYVAFGTTNAEIRLWNFKNELKPDNDFLNRVFKNQHCGRISYISFDSKGERMISACSKYVVVWDIEKYSAVAKLVGLGTYCIFVGFLDNNEVMAISCEQEVHQWNIS